MDQFKFGNLLFFAVLLVAHLPGLHGMATSVNTSIPVSDCPENIKLDSITNALKHLDTAVQNLEEKAHNWAIFRHHIDAWNDQMKTLEHKLDLFKRAQDEMQNYGSKLTSLEFTLNHILGKVIFLSDNCPQQPPPAQAPLLPVACKDGIESALENSELVGDVRRLLSSNTRQNNEIMNRLRNILHYVQNNDNNNINNRRLHKSESRAQGGASRSAGGCNATEQNNGYNVEQALQLLEQQIALLTVSTPTPIDVKQMTILAKKNARQLENVERIVTNADKRLMRWHEDGLSNLHYCQSMSGELATFTESAELLLKRFELMMRKEMEWKLNKDSSCGGGEKTDREEEEEQQEEEEEEEEKKETLEEELSESGKEEIDVRRNDSENEVDQSNEEEVDKDNELEERERSSNGAGVMKPDIEFTEFVHPDKTSCDQLTTPRMDGVYKFSLTPAFNEAKRDFNERFCAFATDGPAWTVIQNRGPYAQQENFNRSWAEYRDGFGMLDKDFWFGNEFIHRLVYHDNYELRIELTNFDNVQVWAEYSIFRLESENYHYNLLIGGHRGTAPDAMQYHNEMDFSTYDRRNDRSVDACCACATGYGSGWWFDNCSEANLNGIYRSTPTGHNYVGISWEKWLGDYSLKSTRMMIRPTNWSNSQRDDEDNADNKFNKDP